MMNEVWIILGIITGVVIVVMVARWLLRKTKIDPDKECARNRSNYFTQHLM